MSPHLEHSNDPANRSMPPGIIIPELIYADLQAASAWLCQTFGFKERLRIGNHRTQLTFGEASVVAVAGSPPNRTEGERTHSIMVRVEDVDQHYEHVRRSGARITSPPNDYPFGERQYTVEDIGSHVWTFTQSIADVDPQDWGGVMAGAAGDMD